MSGLPRWHWDEPLEPLRETLAAGGILAIPTESSYGLAVDPRDPHGVEAIYRVKGRERGKPLLVVAADAEQAVALGVERGAELEAVARLWPAPLTAVLPLRPVEPPGRPLAAAAGGVTLAVRVPAHRRLRALLDGLGFALTATSANRSGEPPVVDPAELEALLETPRAMVVDDGVLPGGPPSTLIAWRRGELQILRPGAFPAAHFARESLNR